MAHKKNRKSCFVRTKFINVILTLNFLGICLLLSLQQYNSWVKVPTSHTKNRLLKEAKEIPPNILAMMEENDFPEDLGIVLEKHSNHSMLEVIGVPLRRAQISQDLIDAAGGVDMYKYAPEVTLNFTPPVPKFSVTDVVYTLSDDIMEKNLKLDGWKYEDKSIVILTPIHNSENDLIQYGQLISELEYPHSKLSLVFGEDGSNDQTLSIAKAVATELKNSGLRRAEVFHFNSTGQVEGSWNDIHHRVSQYQRRQHLAKSRNLLLEKGLRDEDYVLWIDSDVGLLPSDLIQQLLYADKDVVTPCCLFQTGKYSRIYDKNTWRETPLSLEDQKHLPKNQLVLEGYGPTTRIYLPHLRGEGRVVPLDGVGGCSLLIKAACHRSGLKFPEEIYDRHIETEGLAKMAKDMGYGVYGVPFVEVFHK